ncbi:unnamed protein product, partial [Amoebophrya sp. A25]
ERRCQVSKRRTPVNIYPKDYYLYQKHPKYKKRITEHNNRTVPRYPGGSRYRAIWTTLFVRADTHLSHWEDPVTKHTLSNDVPRYFGPVMLHV